MIDAKCARSATNLKTNTLQRVLIYKVKDSLDRAITEAAQKGMTNASVAIPHDMENDVANALRNVLVKLGYSAKLNNNVGIFDERSLVRLPSVTLEVRW